MPGPSSLLLLHQPPVAPTISDSVSSIADLSARWRADQITGVSDGAVAATWPDASGYGYNATQLDPSLEPTWHSSVLNGKPVTRWNGAKWMDSAANPGATVQTIVAVCQLTNVTANRTIRGALANGSLQFRVNTAGAIQFISQNTVVVGSSTSTVSTGVFHYLVGTYNSTTGAYAFYLDGMAAGSGTNAQTLTSTTTRLGDQLFTPNEPFVGDIAEVVTWNRVLTGPELATVDSYIATQYGVGAATPATGTATGTTTATGSASGTRIPKATASGTVTTTGTAAGKRTPKGTGTGTTTSTGAAVGTVPRRGAATGTVTTTGAAIGAVPKRGTATGIVTATGSAAGKRVAKATTAGTVTATGAATAATIRRGTATGTTTSTGSAAGKRTPKATATGVVTTTGAATGRRAPKATATGTGTVTVTGSAVGSAPLVGVNDGTATGTTTTTGTATGRRQPRASSTGTTTTTGTATGTRTPKAAATGTVTVAGSAAGAAAAVGLRTGTATGVVTVTGTAAGRRFAKALTIGTVTVTGVAIGDSPGTGGEPTVPPVITVGAGRSPTISATGSSPIALSRLGAGRELAAVGRSRTLTLDPWE